MPADVVVGSQPPSVGGWSSNCKFLLGHFEILQCRFAYDMRLRGHEGCPYCKTKSPRPLRRPLVQAPSATKGGCQQKNQLLPSPARTLRRSTAHSHGGIRLYLRSWIWSGFHAMVGESLPPLPCSALLVPQPSRPYSGAKCLLTGKSLPGMHVTTEGLNSACG